VYGVKALLVDLGAGTVYQEEFEPSVGRFLGGRQFISHWLTQEVDPQCEPLGEHNDIVFAPGLLAGSHVSSSNRLSVGAKSPLTGGAKEANAGGIMALYLASNRVGAVVLRGKARCLSLVVIERGTAVVQPCPDLEGKGVYETAQTLRSRFGNDCALGLIGPAGERGQAMAAVAFSDKDGHPERFAGRGGLGAVMGSKRIKAVVVRNAGRPEVTSQTRDLSKRVAEIARANPTIRDFFPVLGTAGTVEMVDAVGGLPVRNFSRGRFEAADRIGGNALRRLILDRGGVCGHACMPGCVVRCSNRYVDREGKDVVGPLEYETIALLGSNLGVGDLDAIARLNRFANDFGVDTIELGATLGVALECGFGEFGDYERIRELVSEMAEGTLLGRALAQGAAVAGRVLGAKRVPVVKGQGMPGYDPRAVKGNGVTYITSPMGADHTAGNTIGCDVDHADMAGKAALSRSTQIRCALFDSLGLCEFISYAFNDNPEPFVGLARVRLGDDIDLPSLLDEGRRTIMNELRFNEACGLGPGTNRLPEFMYTEKLPPLDASWDSPPQAFMRFWQEP